MRCLNLSVRDLSGLESGFTPINAMNCDFSPVQGMGCEFLPITTLVCQYSLVSDLKCRFSLVCDIDLNPDWDSLWASDALLLTVEGGRIYVKRRT